MEESQKENSGKPDKKAPAGSKDVYAKYVGAGFQIIAPVILGLLLGRWLDHHFEKTNSIYTIILSSVMIIVSLYIFIKQFMKDN
jgi:hypothetical protein